MNPLPKVVTGFPSGPVVVMMPPTLLWTRLCGCPSSTPNPVNPLCENVFGLPKVRKSVGRSAAVSVVKETAVFVLSSRKGLLFVSPRAFARSKNMVPRGSSLMSNHRSSGNRMPRARSCSYWGLETFQ